MYSRSNGRVLTEYECFLISFAFVHIQRQTFSVGISSAFECTLTSHSSGETEKVILSIRQYILNQKIAKHR